MPLLVSPRDPGQAAELDALFGQRLGFLVRGLAVDAALVALAIMDLARLVGEFVANVLAVLLDLGAHLQQRLAQFLGHLAGKGCHLRRLGHGDRRRRGHGGHVGGRLVALGPQPWGHQGARHLGVAADGATHQGLLFLTLVGLAVLEPAVELVALGAAQSV